MSPQRIYIVDATKQYKKDLKRLIKSGYDMTRLSYVINQLAQGNQLPPSYFDHPLKGNFAGMRKCHIGPDWLLVYEKDRDRLILVLIATGDHRHVLGIE